MFGIRNSINPQCYTLGPRMRLSRRWLGLERVARISHQAAPNSESTVTLKALRRNYELQGVTAVTPIPALAGSRTSALGLHSTHSPLWVSLQARRSAARVLPQHPGSW
jgi:hypothetical protein